MPQAGEPARDSRSRYRLPRLEPGSCQYRPGPTVRESVPPSEQDPVEQISRGPMQQGFADTRDRAVQAADRLRELVLFSRQGLGARPGSL